MRRILLVVTLLAASHGAAIWLGSRRHAADSEAGSELPAKTDRAAAKGGEGISLARLIEESREEPVASGEEEPDEEALVKAAREKMPADADIIAMVMAGTTDPAASFTPETIAAYSLWLDRDPLAALHWYEKWNRDNGWSELEDELARHLARGGFADLQKYLEEVPRGRSLLMDAANTALEKSDPGTVIRAAARFKNAADRLRILKENFSEPGDVIGRLAEIRGMLDKSMATAFMENFETTPEILEEARAAGFPEQWLKMAQDRLENNEPDEDEKILLADLVRKNLSEGGWSSSLTYNPAFREAVPEFDAWENQLKEGRMQPQEMYARLKAAIPGSEGIGRELAKLVVDSGFASDPEGTVRWMQGLGDDWPQLYAKAVGRFGDDLSPERLGDLVMEFEARAGLPEEVLRVALDSYKDWFETDPEACLEGIAKLRKGHLKTELQAVAVPAKEEAEEEGEE